MIAARVALVEHEVAGESPSDDALAALLGLQASQVQAFSRGRPRHFAPDGEGPADLAARAAKRLLERASLDATELDLIIFATNTPDVTFPGSACFLQGLLGADTVGCLDVRSQCTGFLVALDTAARFVATGTCRRVLVAAGEVPSHQNRFDGFDPMLACSTGDGAAVVLVEPEAEAEEAGGRILAVRAIADGRLHRQFWCEYPASRHRERGGVARGQRLTRWMIEEGKIYPTIDRAAAAETALREVPTILDETLQAAGLERVDALVVAHVCPDTQARLGTLLSGLATRVSYPDVLYTYAATLPIALAQGLAAGTLVAGETVALATAGSGASWGAAVMRV